MRAATTHSAGTTLFTFPALKWTITTIQGVVAAGIKKHDPKRAEEREKNIGWIKRLFTAWN